MPAYTYEQYQQHQEQLSLMHKQQLEQVQLQQQANSSTAANPSHVSPSRRLRRCKCSRFLLSSLTGGCSSPPAEPGTHAGPGQSSVRCLGPRHHRPTARSENQGGVRPWRRSERRPLPLRYCHRPLHPISLSSSYFKLSSLFTRGYLIARLK